MEISSEKLKELLVDPGHITEEQFASAEKEAEKTGQGISSVLLEKNLIKDDQLGRVIAESVGFPFIILQNTQIDDEVFNLIPEIVARHSGVIAFAKSDQGVEIAMLNPNDLETRHFMEKRLGGPVIPYIVTEKDFGNVMARYKAGLAQEFKNILESLEDDSLSQEERDSITIKIVDILLTYSYESKASDIHIEPYDEKVVIRFRIDGVMHDVLDIPKNYLELILTRVKIMAKMRTDEHRAAQDGKFRFKAGTGENVDVRVSIVPVVEGENVVMRLLSAKNRQFGLADMGLGKSDAAKIEKAIDNPHGMILTSGPTGSGKTTTIYAILKVLNTREVHISTIEDPVEYDIEGISQIQVNTKTDLTFAKGLRAIVRQDPDIIMVGEIRDEETASIAVNSAMTGHLVLSTLHANDAATTLPRLLDMGIEPFLIASTVNVSIAQRLIRKICEECRASYSLTADDKKMIEREQALKDIFETRGKKDLDKVTFFKGAGCKVCGNSGYSGRLGVFEVLVLEQNIKDLIVQRAPSDKILETARKNGMTTMLEDGVEKVFQGITTLEEVLRVTKM